MGLEDTTSILNVKILTPIFLLETTINIYIYIYIYNL